MIWLGTRDDGVIAIDATTLASRRVRLGASNITYGDENIHALFKSEAGVVFIAANDALTRFDPRRGAFLTVLGGITPTSVLGWRNVGQIFETQLKTLWLAEATNSVDIIDAKARRLEHRKPAAGGLPKTNIRSHAVLSPRSLFLGTDVGLFGSSLDAQHVERFDQPGRAPDDSRCR